MSESSDSSCKPVHRSCQASLSLLVRLAEIASLHLLQASVVEVLSQTLSYQPIQGAPTAVNKNTGYNLGERLAPQNH